MQVPCEETASKEGRASMTPQPRDWRELAEKVSNEKDPDKLEVLIDELNRTLDRDERRRKGSGVTPV